MELNGAVDTIVGYAKNGNEFVYDMLTDNSKKELENYSKKEIVDSLYRFFNKNNAMSIDSRGKDLNMAQVSFFNTRNTQNIFYTINFFWENNKWKLVWNEKALKENS